jgi:hypothetical protein
MHTEWPTGTPSDYVRVSTCVPRARRECVCGVEVRIDVVCCVVQIPNGSTGSTYSQLSVAPRECSLLYSRLTRHTRSAAECTGTSAAAARNVDDAAHSDAAAACCDADAHSVAARSVRRAAARGDARAAATDSARVGVRGDAAADADAHVRACWCHGAEVILANCVYA